MRIIKTANVDEGMVLAEDISNAQGAVILAEGVKLNLKHISALVGAGIEYVAIKDETDLEAAPSEIPDKTDEVDPALNMLYHDTVDSFKDFYENCASENTIEIKRIDDMLTPILKKAMKNSNIMSTFRSINQNLGEYTYKHSVNVSLLAAMLAKWMGFDEKFTKDIATAGLLHDIGKARIPSEIINKPGKLTESEFEIIKKHSTYSYEIIKDIAGLSEDIKIGVLQHHERIDGSGYPFGKKDDAIHPYAKILSVCDVYDSMCSRRSYKDAMSPFKVYDFILQTSVSKLDIAYVSCFIKNISTFFIGNIVLLSSGDKGKIVMLNNSSPTRPFVQTENGFKDLSKDYSIEIEEIL